MRILELLVENKEFNLALEDFLPFAKKQLKLKKLPKMTFVKSFDEDEQPSFGGYDTGTGTIEIATDGRHPIDVLRTLAHELVHYKQDQENRLNPHSGETGSDEENEANVIAGIIMRRFNKRYSKHLVKKKGP